MNRRLEKEREMHMECLILILLLLHTCSSTILHSTMKSSVGSTICKGAFGLERLDEFSTFLKCSAFVISRIILQV